MEEYVVIVLALMSAFAILLLHAKENFNKPLYPIELGTKDDEAFHQLQKIAPKSFMGSSDWFIKRSLHLLFLGAECVVMYIILNVSATSIISNSNGTIPEGLTGHELGDYFNTAYNIIFAALIVSGFIPNVPLLNKIERAVIEFLHDQSNVPFSAQAIYQDIKKLRLDKAVHKQFIYQQRHVIFNADFFSLANDNNNRKFSWLWLTYNYLFYKLEPQSQSLINMKADCGDFSWQKLREEHYVLQEYAHFIVESGGDINIDEKFYARTKRAYQKLSAIIACSPKIQKMSNKERKEKFKELGFLVNTTTSVKTGVVSESLRHGFTMGILVFIVCFSVFGLYKHNVTYSSATAPVSIYISDYLGEATGSKAIDSKATDSDQKRDPLTLSFIWAAFSTMMFTLTAWFTYSMHHWLVNLKIWNVPTFSPRKQLAFKDHQFDCYALVAFTCFVMVSISLFASLYLSTSYTLMLNAKIAMLSALSPFVISIMICFRFDRRNENKKPDSRLTIWLISLFEGILMAFVSLAIFRSLGTLGALETLNIELAKGLFFATGLVTGFVSSLLIDPEPVNLRKAKRDTCGECANGAHCAHHDAITIINDKDEQVEATIHDISKEGISLSLTAPYIDSLPHFFQQQEISFQHKSNDVEETYQATVVGTTLSTAQLHLETKQDKHWTNFYTNCNYKDKHEGYLHSLMMFFKGKFEGAKA